MTRSEDPGDRPTWLLLAHQLPPKPAYLRVKVWRRLQDLGAVAIKASLYALPSNPDTREDFQWLLREIREGGGDATIFEARLVDGLTDQQVRALFDRARDADYAALAAEARSVAEAVAPDPELWRARVPEMRAQLARLRRRLAEIVGIDFFGANGRETVEGLLSGTERRLADAEERQDTEVRMPVEQEKPRGRTWVTRRGVHVDRIASAWLIRRFIDPDARFKFVPDKGYAPEPGEIRFDMFEAEYTHEGDHCTFEVLLARLCEPDRALQAIGEIVHDIDLKDGKFGREEAAGIRTLVAGIAAATEDDARRLERGASALDDLYEYFRRKRD
ncbi:chromate resistance protein ChrB domain-containing protein [Arenibaculum pallidiluteum]|uniref:chromate resistance protein ChrB domain-containing protein n=1 Tax=Arenibaculum pallidiluteum TaxID=2812559 RepID=UPI001A9739E6|nr:chromate resistance protein ChrB domain-containing protein [Arenibaculum pallidiluteum]